MDRLRGLQVSSSVLLKSSFNRFRSDEWVRMRKKLGNAHRLNMEGVTMKQTIDIIYYMMQSYATLRHWLDLRRVTASVSMHLYVSMYLIWTHQQ